MSIAPCSAAIPEISVVIPTCNAAPLLRRCLQSVHAQQGAPPFDVLVVDDASTDGTAEMVRAEFPRACYLRGEENRGPGTTRNAGWRAARGEIVAYIDQDVVVAPNWLACAWQHFADPAVDGVEGRTEVSHPEQITPFTHWTKNLRGGEYPFCNMFLRRSVLEASGGFDERFYDPKRRVHFREDIELAFRLLDQACRIPYAPDVLAYHPPLPALYSRPLKLAQRYYFDPLLCRLHPARFAQAVERHQVGPLVIRRPRHYASIVSVLTSLALMAMPRRWRQFRVLAGLLWVGTYAFGPLSVMRHNHPRNIPARHLLMAALVFVPVPWVYTWSYARGLVAFRGITPADRVGP